MIGVISSSIVVTQADQKGRCKKVQSGNKEWATAIACINIEGCDILPFLIVKDAYHLANWYSREDALPNDWVVKSTYNGWTNNETGLEWIQHFQKHTIERTRGGYRLLILDRHESHISPAFEEYCKFHNIVTISLPPHSSHLLQLLDVRYFGVLKCCYSQELEIFIKAHINHITKIEFFIVFQKAYTRTMTKENIKAGFSGAGLIPYNPQAVLSKLDVKLCTPTPTGPPIVDPWTSQTPHNSTDTLCQTELVRTKITSHERSSPTPIFEATTQLAKGTEILVYRLTLAEARISILEQANEALSKCRRAKKSCIQQGGALSIQKAKDILSRSKKLAEQGSGSQTARCCSKCKKPGHTVRKCQIDVEMVDVQ